MDSGICLDIPKQITFFEAEFITYILYKIWHPTAPSNGKIQYHIYKKHLEFPSQILNYNSTNIISPSGTKEWYPQLVLLIYDLILKTEIPIELITLGLLNVARLRKQSIKTTQDQHIITEFYQIFVLSIILSQKQHSDYRFTNRTWSLNVQYTEKELFVIEREYINTMDFNFHVTVQQFEKWFKLCKTLQREHSLCVKACLMGSEYAEFVAKLAVKRMDLANEIGSVRAAGVVVAGYKGYSISSLFDGMTMS